MIVMIITIITIITIAPILIAGVASAGGYLWRRRWIDAALVVVAAASLAGMAADVRLPAAIPKPLAVAGDGLREAAWRDHQARPIAWAMPKTAVLRLDFPRRLALGRMFILTVRHTMPGAARLQLLAENGQVIAETRASNAAISVQWLPPAAESLVLRARLLSADGKTLAEGPVPVQVVDAAPLQVSGRFGAPSFDLRALSELLGNSGALLDWQVTLGKTVTRSEAARTPLAAPNLLLTDAAWFERAPAAARSAMLAQVALGTPLIILGANAADPRLWRSALELELGPQPDKTVGALLALQLAPFNPAAASAGAWRSADGALWSRRWHKGRITWVGVGDWHRYAISDPQQLGVWWQGAFDQAGVERDEDVVWEAHSEMPFAGERLEVCARGVSGMRGMRGEAVFAALGQAAPWQRRPDKADASCVAVWPKAPGWLAVRAQDGASQLHHIYVYSKDDWPLWQAAQRRDATARYAARTPAPAAAHSTPMPAWPFGVLCALAMLALWWRERR